MTLAVDPFPLCCGIAVVSGFGNDPRHAHRDRRDGAPTQAEIEQYLTEAARFAEAGAGVFSNGLAWPNNVGRVGMLLAAVNIPQREFMYPIFRRLGWRRAGVCQNLHSRDYSENFLFRKVIANAREEG